MHERIVLHASYASSFDPFNYRYIHYTYSWFASVAQFLKADAV